MKKNILRVVLLCITLSTFNFQLSTAQRVPTEEDVLPKILSTDSPYYYQPLMARYLEGDESLTADDYYYLYYGFAYNDRFDAHAELPGSATMNAVLRSAGDNPSRAEALELIEAGRRNMAVDPFSPSTLNLMTWAYGLVGDSTAMRQSAARFAGVLQAIESSGTGAREKSPWHILRFTHANDLVAARGQTIVNRQVRTREVEYIQLEPGPGRAKGYFFNYERVYWRPYEGERVKKKSNWEFNGIPL